MNIIVQYTQFFAWSNYLPPQSIANIDQHGLEIPVLDKRFTLPSSEEMLQRLLKVDDEPHLRQKFYPLLTQHAGEEKVAEGVVIILQLAIHDCTQGLPAMMALVLDQRMNAFIDALCPDEEVASDAKEFFALAQALAADR
ncbi:MAG: hypothetical protein AAB921_00210 [Patescibacteria group bacterium]